MRELAAHFAAAQTPARRPKPAPDAEARRLGRRIASLGIPQQGVPPCVACHGPRGGPRNPIYPLLAGQDEAYLVQQLKLWRQGTRGGSPYAHLMHTVGERLNPGQIAAVAAYYASQ